MEDVTNLNIVDSTSLYIKNNFNNLNNFSFVFSNYQTGGKGRGDNKWFSNSNENLLFSFVIKDTVLIDNYMKISLSSAVVISQILKEYQIESKIKWPNDVFVNDSKICGILLESHMTDGRIDGIIVGIGLNVNQIKFSVNSRYSITSMKLEIKKDIDIGKLKAMIISKIRDEFKDLVLSNNSVKYINDNNYLIGKKCQLLINNQVENIKIIKINDDCSLNIITNNKEENIISGEIIFK